jgi:hypothetical protein
MAKPRKGERTPGSGRVKGTPNKTTAEVRVAPAALATANVSRVQAWLDRTAATDPTRVLDLYLRMLEYHIPKLARTEFTGPEGERVSERIDVTLKSATEALIEDRADRQHIVTIAATKALIELHGFKVDPARTNRDPFEGRARQAQAEIAAHAKH